MALHKVRRERGRAAGYLTFREATAMTIKRDNQDGPEDFWYTGKMTRRRLVGWGGGILGATMLVPAPWRAAFGGEKPFKVGSIQPLTGPGAAGGKTALVGLQLAADRINRMGGINGRPVELLVEDSESKPDVGRRKTEKLALEDNVDVSCGGFLSNVCLACMPVWATHKIVNMIGVCLDTTITGSRCNKYTFRPFDAAPAQAVAFAPHLIKMAKKWHIAYVDYSWGQSTRDAYVAAIKAHGGEVVGTTGIPLGTPDMTPFLSKISGNFEGLFGIFFGTDGVNIGNQAYDLGLTKKYKWAGDGAIAEPSNLPALGHKIDGFVGIDRYIPVFQGPLDTPYNRRFFAAAMKRLESVAPQAPVPDRYVQSDYEALNCLKLGMEKSHFRGREDSDKLVAALEGIHLPAGDDFPQGDKIIRKEDHQAFVNEFIFEIKGGKHQLLDTVPWQKTMYPGSCKLSA
jgi:branched-chain amino acid transport system substrate-binding protein